MEISYRREAKRNYLVAGMAENTAGYEARMLAHNEIRGLLRMYITYQDGQPSYCYDITFQTTVKPTSGNPFYNQR